MKNIEIEKKYKINKKIYEEIEHVLNSLGIKNRVEKQNDIYFSPLSFPFFGGTIDNECLRIRVLEDKIILSYKKFFKKTSTKESYCEEHEIQIDDIKMMKKILKDLRIEEAFTLNKVRKYYIYKNCIEIALDKVENLGYFIELEIINNEKKEESLKKIENFLNQFHITEEMRNFEGYSYLLYNLNTKK